MMGLKIWRAYSRRPWTEEEDEVLRHLVEKRFHYRTIGRILGRSEFAIKTRARQETAGVSHYRSIEMSASYERDQFVGRLRKKRAQIRHRKAVQG